jgi:hypothetical protein
MTHREPERAERRAAGEAMTDDDAAMVLALRVNRQATPYPDAQV